MFIKGYAHRVMSRETHLRDAFAKDLVAQAQEFQMPFDTKMTGRPVCVKRN